MPTSPEKNHPYVFTHTPSSNDRLVSSTTGYTNNTISSYCYLPTHQPPPKHNSVLHTLWKSYFRKASVFVLLLTISILGAVCFMFGVIDKSALIVGKEGYDEVFTVMGSIFIIPLIIMMYRFIRRHLPKVSPETERKIWLFTLRGLHCVIFIAQQGLLIVYLVKYMNTDGMLYLLFIIPDFVILVLMLWSTKFTTIWAYIYVISIALKIGLFWPNLDTHRGNFSASVSNIIDNNGDRVDIGVSQLLPFRQAIHPQAALVVAASSVLMGSFGSVNTRIVTPIFTTLDGDNEDFSTTSTEDTSLFPPSSDLSFLPNGYQWNILGDPVVERYDSSSSGMFHPQQMMYDMVRESQQYRPQASQEGQSHVENPYFSHHRHMSGPTLLNLNRFNRMIKSNKLKHENEMERDKVAMNRSSQMTDVIPSYHNNCTQRTSHSGSIWGEIQATMGPLLKRVYKWVYGHHDISSGDNKNQSNINEPYEAPDDQGFYETSSLSCWLSSCALDHHAPSPMTLNEPFSSFPGVLSPLYSSPNSLRTSAPFVDNVRDTVLVETNTSSLSSAKANIINPILSSTSGGTYRSSFRDRSVAFGSNGFTAVLMMSIPIIYYPVIISKLEAGMPITEAYSTDMAAVFAYTIHFMDFLELYMIGFERQSFQPDVQYMMVMFSIMGFMACNLYYIELFFRSEEMETMVKHFQPIAATVDSGFSAAGTGKDEALLHYFIWAVFYIDIPYASLRWIAFCVHGTVISFFFAKNILMITSVGMMVIYHGIVNK
eukprot:Tbor_TRINITY_DN1995_c0_g1::TRINITY_DN1995_c0_g1_i1::g.3549::m.3549